MRRVPSVTEPAQARQSGQSDGGRGCARSRQSSASCVLGDRAGGAALAVDLVPDVTG